MASDTRLSQGKAFLFFLITPRSFFAVLCLDDFCCLCRAHTGAVEDCT